MTTIVTVHHHYKFGRAGFESSQQTRMNLAKMNGFDYVHLITSPQLVGYEECFRSIGFDYGSIYALDEVFIQGVLLKKMVLRHMFMLQSNTKFPVMHQS